MLRKGGQKERRGTSLGKALPNDNIEEKMGIPASRSQIGTKMQIKIFNIPKAFETDGMYAIRNSGLVASVRSKSLSFHLFLNQSSKHFN